MDLFHLSPDRRFSGLEDIRQRHAHVAVDKARGLQSVGVRRRPISLLREDSRTWAVATSTDGRRRRTNIARCGRRRFGLRRDKTRIVLYRIAEFRCKTTVGIPQLRNRSDYNA